MAEKQTGSQSSMNPWLRGSMVAVLILVNSVMTLYQQGEAESLPIFDRAGALLVGAEGLEVAGYGISANWIGSKLFYATKLMINLLALTVMYGWATLPWIGLLLPIWVATAIVANVIFRLSGIASLGWYAFEVINWGTVPHMPLFVMVLVVLYRLLQKHTSQAK